ncbi:MAG: biotin carboxylase N-terminal domain-containing protein [Chloroflexota bacterium]
MLSNHFQKILIANRGEIAIRIIHACQAMQIDTVAVYSEADTHALHTKLADEAVYLGESAAQSSYLNAEKIIAIATHINADAIHPGYGFLAEDADFAQCCADHNITFIGPNVQAMRTMASKVTARQLAETVGVPVLAGYADEDQGEATLMNAAETIGYPLLIKSAAGGGGVGMRVVQNTTEFSSCLSAVQQEARAAFGDARVMLERYLDSARHIEVQIVGDKHGNRIHCYERECSIQRRRQKIVEETPSPFCQRDETGHLRLQLTEAALKIADAVGYDSLGTVEFLVENRPNPSFYFLEMNTRLQVEHGITELVTGIDLVQEQIHIAQGERLRYRQDDVKLNGHAIECRLNAENPCQQFSPTTGTITAFDVPETAGTRIDSGITVGSEVTVHYDSLLAKFMSHDVDRAAAIQKMKRLLNKALVLGLQTNQTYFGDVMVHDAFVRGETTTQFTDIHQATLHGADRQEPPVAFWIMSALHKVCHHTLPVDPKRPQRRYRQVHLGLDEHMQCVSANRRSTNQYHFLLVEQSYTVDIVEQYRQDDVLRLTVEMTIYDTTQRYTSHSTVINHQLQLHSLYGNHIIDIPSRFQRAHRSADVGSYHAAMPGLIIGVHVQEGDTVKTGDTLVVMESMKMESRTLAKQDGVVRLLHVGVGDSVLTGAQLIEITT